MLESTAGDWLTGRHRFDAAMLFDDAAVQKLAIGGE
jgi:hypothetical protein